MLGPGALSSRSRPFWWIGTRVVISRVIERPAKAPQPGEALDPDYARAPLMRLAVLMLTGTGRDGRPSGSSSGALRTKVASNSHVTCRTSRHGIAAVVGIGVDFNPDSDGRGERDMAR